MGEDRYLYLVIRPTICSGCIHNGNNGHLSEDLLHQAWSGHQWKNMTAVKNGTADSVGSKKEVILQTYIEGVKKLDATRISLTNHLLWIQTSKGNLVGDHSSYKNVTPILRFMAFTQIEFRMMLRNIYISYFDFLYLLRYSFTRLKIKPD